MKKKFTHFLLMSAVWFSMTGCNDEEIAAPSKPTFQVSKTTATVGEEVTFTIPQQNADALSLLPYGEGGDAGILLNKFTDGVTTVVFSYARPGTFNAIVVANNHSEDGESVKNVKSEPISVTITTSNRSISAFTFDEISTETVIDETAKTIVVTVPYGTDVTKLKATFTASGFSTVSTGGVNQVSGTTENNFSAPKVFKVTANDGSVSEYTVTVNVTPIDLTNTIKSVTAIAVSTSADEKELGVAVDNTARTIVIYDTLGTPSTQFDSVRVGYELDGKFARFKYGGETLQQDSLLNLTTSQELQVFSQDSANASGRQAYDVYAVAAPKLELSFPALIPDPADGVKPVNFNIDINALSGTDVDGVATMATTTSAAGVTVTGIKVDGATYIPGMDVDYSEPVKFQLTVNDTNIGVTYIVTYTVTVTLIP